MQRVHKDFLYQKLESFFYSRNMYWQTYIINVAYFQVTCIYRNPTAVLPYLEICQTDITKHIKKYCGSAKCDFFNQQP